MPQELHDKAVELGVGQLTELAIPGGRIETNWATLTRMANDFIYEAQGRPEKGDVDGVSEEIVKRVCDSLLQQAPIQLK